MLTSALGNKRPRPQHGFSLLEVIIVLFIIGISTSVGIRYLPATEQNSLSHDAKRLTQRLQAAQRYAIQHRQPLRWQQQEGGYGFEPLTAVPFSARFPSNLAHTAWQSTAAVNVRTQPASPLLIHPAWLYEPLLITLDNGVDSLIIRRDLHGVFELITP